MNNLTKEDLIAFETKIATHFDEGRLPFLVHLSGGNEDQLINTFKMINEGDYVLSTHRSHYHAILHGLPQDEVEQKILNGRSMFIFDREKNFFSSAIIGGQAAIAAGIAWALKRKGSDKKVWCFLGDGNEDSGHLAEAVRYVDGWDLPCTFIIENNDRSVESAVQDRWGKSKVRWPNCVITYDYDIPWPHARTGHMADFSNTVYRSGEELFPKPPQENFLPIGRKEFIGTYEDAIIESMDDLAKDENTIFIGYNVAYGDAMNTLRNVSDEQKLETPVAENLMMGLGMGMSFEGFRPIVFFERQDFMLTAFDAIGNHLNMMNHISHGEYNCPMIIRAVVAKGGMFYSGPTHEQDLTPVIRKLVDFPVFDPIDADDMHFVYNLIRNANGPTLVVERKNLFGIR